MPKKRMDKKKNDEGLTCIADDGIFIIDKDHKIIYFNREAYLTSGFLPKDVVGIKYNDILKFVEKKTFAEKNITTDTKNTPIMLIKKNGAKIPVITSSNNLTDTKGQPIGHIIIFRDMSERKKIEKAKTDFISIVSHQFRTPLTAVNLFAEMLATKEVGKLNNLQQEYLDSIIHSTARMTELINNLLNVSRLEAGTVTAEPILVQLEDLTQEIIGEVSLWAEARNCAIRLITPKEKLQKLLIGPNLIRQVIYNLVSNSIRYLSQKKGRIIVRLEQDKDDIVISVKDNGIGIPKEAQPKIFERFFRADNAMQSETKGTGLGLYTTKMIVETAGGKIWFESEEGRGSTFYATIPIKENSHKKQHC